MLVVAMAFGWCVISAQAAEKPHSARAETARDEGVASPQAQTTLQAAPAPGTRTPIRSAIPADVIAFAKTLVNLPMGAEQVEVIDGQRYVFVLERHYHPPGFVGAPNGWHKGVTAYELH
jgi:hypothetical protein